MTTLMKKHFLWMLALCCGLVMSMAFVACDDDDDDDFKREETEEEKSYFDREMATADVEYKVSLGRDELQLYDVKLEYLDAEGKSQSFMMDKREWTLKRSLLPKDLPAKFELRVKPSQKEGLKLNDEDQFEVGCITRIQVTVKNQYGRVICDRDDMGLSNTEFVTMTGQQISNSWSSIISDLFGSLFSTDKKTLEVQSKKIIFNGMSEHYW